MTGLRPVECVPLPVMIVKGFGSHVEVHQTARLYGPRLSSALIQTLMNISKRNGVRSFQGLVHCEIMQVNGEAVR